MSQQFYKKEHFCSSFTEKCPKLFFNLVRSLEDIKNKTEFQAFKSVKLKVLVFSNTEGEPVFPDLKFEWVYISR